MEAPRVAIIGAGNVAWHLAPALRAAGCDVRQVCARSLSHAQELAARIGGDNAPQAIDNAADLDTSLDFYLIAATDDAVPQIAATMPHVDGIVAHTSGSVPMQALMPASGRVGVFYPLQTFSKSGEVDVKQVPFFTEASSPEVLVFLDALAAKVGGSVDHADSRQRGVLHLAAVFACNFANHLWAISDDVLAANGYSLKVFEPLLKLTLSKAMSMPPAQAQTGPAARGDAAVLAKHMAQLSASDAEIYRLLSQSIMNRTNQYNR